MSFSVVLQKRAFSFFLPSLTFDQRQYPISLSSLFLAPTRKSSSSIHPPSQNWLGLVTVPFGTFIFFFIFIFIFPFFFPSSKNHSEKKKKIGERAPAIGHWTFYSYPVPWL